MTIPAFPKAAATHQHGGAASCSAAATSSTPISGTGLLDLPLDTICTILHRLKPKDLIAASLTCRTLHGLIDQPNTWLTLCRKWEGQLALSEWLVHANSAKCLFRLLHTLSPLVGVWAAEDLAPRGGLLYVTWERMAVVAYRIIPDWLDGNLISARLFTISAFPDGTTQLSLVTGRGADDEFPLELPGVLVWESPARAKFHLQTLLPPSSRSPASFAASPFAKVAGNRVSSSPPAAPPKGVVAGPSSPSSPSSVLSSLSSLGAAERLKATFQRAGLARFAATAGPLSSVLPTASASSSTTSVTPSAARAAVPSLPPRPPSSRSAGSSGLVSTLQQQQQQQQLEASRATASSGISRLQQRFGQSGLSIGGANLLRVGAVSPTGKEEQSSKRLQLRALQYLTGLKQDSGSSPSKAAAAATPSKRTRSECDSNEASPDESRRKRSRTCSVDVASTSGTTAFSPPQVAFSASSGSSAGASAMASAAGSSASAGPSASSAEWSLKRRAFGALHYADETQSLGARMGAGGGAFAGFGGSSSGKVDMRGCGGTVFGQLKGSQQPSEWSDGQTKRVPVPKSTYHRVPVAGEIQTNKSARACDTDTSGTDLSRSRLPPWVRDLEGLWTGVFGQHGVEILNVAVESGEIVATKIVGDPNVPGGHVSFKARIDSVQTAADDSDRWNEVVGQARSLIRAQGQAADPALGQQLQFSNLLEGEGRIADYNFKNPQWVNGTLLVDSAGRISFLWEELNFLVQMKRLHVEELLFNA
ncbi:unnamed protein product [Closterium sp. Naga37s-1]|nr:unnamed protein product [Closterium sp. Naga37s-1]